MDVTSIIEIIAGILVVYLFIKFIAIPIVRIVLGIILFLIVIYLLQRFLHFNLNQVLAPFGISFNSSKLGLNLNWLSQPANYVIGAAENFIKYIWGNFYKATNK